MKTCVKIVCVLFCLFINTTRAEERSVYPGVILTSHKGLKQTLKFSNIKYESLSSNSLFIKNIKDADVPRVYSRSSSLCRKAVIRRIKKTASGYVLCVPNDALHITETPNDYYFSYQYGPQLMSAPNAWDITTGNQDLLAIVIDTGIEAHHPDLAQNMWVNPNEIPGNRIDDDYNGYIDDVHGINAITRVGSGMDDNGHGTHVAGIIGAVGNNSIGISGITQRVKLVSAKFLSSSGIGSSVNAIRAINYGIMLKQRGHNVVVMNNSYGSSTFSSAFYSAVKQAESNGILFVAAAGNSARNTDFSPSYPANYQATNVISVASVTSTGSLSLFSNFGLRTVHVAAPGSGILSTILNHKYGYKSGTSMAAPHVSGLSVLTKSVCDLSVSDLKNNILNNGTKTSSLSSAVSSGSIVNAVGSVYAARSVCATPTPEPQPTVGPGTPTQTPTPTHTATNTPTITPTPTNTPTSTPTATPTFMATPVASFSTISVSPGGKNTLSITNYPSTISSVRVQFVLRTSGQRSIGCSNFATTDLSQGAKTIELTMPETTKYFAKVHALIKDTSGVTKTIMATTDINTTFIGSATTQQINDLCATLSAQIK